ncbi:hypothetical protein COCMIDRAFT_102516 [Bipolaris oryzae ATCC 44560]|uniref:Uncharacterized protein n=1 Tax=Bipolaris oryzae ATCC 44560 TaxID=930090 RepID=W6YTN6_COCMI|nr:uncharacterized protein COCMIDRAFT_102516 [Bipolaris oryzae ATCC 44560]EUC42812.1 hypothetical protein COCMIDRAFT_102516 [Bipolaris oryzae ATCC 44560]
MAMWRRRRRGLGVRVHLSSSCLQRSTRAFSAWLTSIWQTGLPHLHLCFEPCAPRQRQTLLYGLGYATPMCKPLGQNYCGELGLGIRDRK